MATASHAFHLRRFRQHRLEDRSARTRHGLHLRSTWAVVATKTDASGVSRFTYDALWPVTSVTDELNNKTTYEYDANGNSTSMLDARGSLTEYEYDAANRLSKVTNPDGTTRTYTYNFRGQKVTDTIYGPAPAVASWAPLVMHQFVQTTSFVYDNAGQLIKVIHPDQAEINADLR